MGLDIELTPEDLESEAEELSFVRGSAFSHIALAESIWNESYGDFHDPGLLGFSDKEKNNTALPAKLWDALVQEYFELVCTNNSKYKELRSKVQTLKGSPATVIVSSIAVGIGAVIGLAAGVLVPFVAIFLHGTLTVGNNAICRLLAGRASEIAGPTSGESER